MSTNKERCALDSTRVTVPEVGLGEFVEAFSSKNTPFPTKMLLWILVPIVGWILVAILLFTVVFTRIFGSTVIVYIYKEGFLWYKKTFVGKETNTIIRFDDIGGIRTSKIMHYQSSYGIKTYGRTELLFEVCDKPGNCLLSYKNIYRNKQEDEDKYNALGFAINDILNIWNEKAVERFNKQIATNGEATFRTYFDGKPSTVIVSPTHVASRGFYAKGNFRYSFQDGWMSLYPSQSDQQKQGIEYFTLNVNDMYDKTVFLLALSHFFGIN